MENTANELKTSTLDICEEYQHLANMTKPDNYDIEQIARGLYSVFESISALALIDDSSILEPDALRPISEYVAMLSMAAFRIAYAE